MDTSKSSAPCAYAPTTPVLRRSQSVTGRRLQPNRHPPARADDLRCRKSHMAVEEEAINVRSQNHPKLYLPRYVGLHKIPGLRSWCGTAKSSPAGSTRQSLRDSGSPPDSPSVMNTALSSEYNFVAQLQQFGLQGAKAMKLPHGVDRGGRHGPPQRNHHCIQL